MVDIKDECYRERRKRDSPGIPDKENLKFPFLAYGFFKPHQLAYHLIKGYVYDAHPITINNKLNHINGMPVLEYETFDNWEVRAYIIDFKKPKRKKAYKTISLTKHKNIYKWDVITVLNHEGKLKKVNALMNASDEADSIYTMEWNDYDWRNDPIYQKTLDYLDENIAQLKIELNSDDEEIDNFMKFIKVQSLYRTLWTAIDRFLTFRYGDVQSWNVRKWADEQFFKDALKENYDALCKQQFYNDDLKNNDWKDIVFSAKDLAEFELNEQKPTCSALYYYTLRNNVVHAGKMLLNEVNMLLNALLGLTEIFRYSIDYISNKKY